MSESGKKLSFSFSKVSKLCGSHKQIKFKAKEDVQYIDCLDSKTIVFKKDGEEEENISSLVIPLSKPIHDKPQTNQKEDVQRKGIQEAEIPTGGDDVSGNSLEETAAREILEDVKKSTEAVDNSNTSTLKIIKSRHRKEDSKVSSLADYGNIPIGDYGLAMLRGMGWNPGKERIVTNDVSKLRPGGMGLGANKLASFSAPPSTPQEEVEEELKVIKGAFVQVISGARRGQYGQIEGFNEDSGRVIIRLSLHSSAVSMNEYAFKLVTKEEYNNNSRVLSRCI